MPWPSTVPEARELQLAMRERLVLRPPAGFAPRTIAGADVSMERTGALAHAAIVVLDAQTLETVEEATARERLRFPYVPGYLTFRELPALDAAWQRLRGRPDVVVFDAHGFAHPRRFGLASYGGVHWNVPSVGCAKSILVGAHGPLAAERGSIAPLIHQGEVIGAAVRSRSGVAPVYVSAGHLMDLDTAVDIVLRLTPRFREPETTRRAHRRVNDLRRAEMG